MLLPVCVEKNPKLDGFMTELAGPCSVSGSGVWICCFLRPHMRSDAQFDLWTWPPWCCQSVLQQPLTRLHSHKCRFAHVSHLANLFCFNTLLPLCSQGHVWGLLGEVVGLYVLLFPAKTFSFLIRLEKCFDLWRQSRFFHFLHCVNKLVVHKANFFIRCCLQKYLLYVLELIFCQLFTSRGDYKGLRFIWSLLQLIRCEFTSCEQLNNMKLTGETSCTIHSRTIFLN